MSTSPPPSPSPASQSESQNRPPPKRILVCGGGIIGTCTAYFLSQKRNLKSASSSSTRITLIEKSAIACAASGKAAGFLALDWCDDSPLSSLARAGFILHRSLSLKLNGPQSYGYRPLTTLSIPFATPGKSSSPPRKSTHDLLPSWIDGPTAGVPKTIGTVETTAQTHPQLFTRTLIEKAHGVEVVIGEVVKINVEGGKVTGAAVREGESHRFVEADVVVLALGPWSNRSEILSSLFSVSGVKTHSIILRPPEPSALTPHALCLSHEDSPVARLESGIYPRPSGDVFVCGMMAPAEVPDNNDEIVGDPDSIAALHSIAGTVSSHLGKDQGAEVVAERACFLPCTDDGLPVIGEIPGAEGCFVATGHGYWGILTGPATGASLAELILDGKPTTVDLTPFSPSRFSQASR